ncbi:MAG TPA: EAL domain-containing protein [Chroococcidiopsis sp.]
MTKILVIEDDIMVQALIQKLLTSEGFDVLSASDGHQGLELAQAQPDLIISDIMMPGWDGYEVLEQLSKNPDTARIPFIFLSAKSDRTDRRHGMEMGADDYLTKPFTRSELLGAISARLSKQKSITQPYLDEMKRAADSLSQLAYRDLLTGLPNRILMHHRLQEALRSAARSNKVVATLCINLDQFKAINDEMGYPTGDLLLKSVALRLQTLCGETTIARLNGAEFSVLLTELDAIDEVGDRAIALLNALTEPYIIDNISLQIRPSMGIAVFPNHGNNPEQLLHQADIAMRHAQRRSQGKYQFYDVEMDALAKERRSLERDLNGALAKDEFHLLYQPQVNLVTGRIVGAEALLRWNYQDHEPVYPSRFIPIAEESGLIVPMGEWVLQAACQQARQWQDKSPLPVRVSVNLSARQFRQHNLLELVEQVLNDTQLPAEMLVLEMTETSVMEDVEATITVLQALKAMGVSLSIDDFGTGYSSLNYLKRFPLDTLKIDKAFIDDVTSNAHDSAIAKAIIAMANSMQLKVIAEGVETVEQLNFLRQSGCHAMQGYLFSPPVDADTFETMLRENKRLTLI